MKAKTLRLLLVGATGAVGQEVLKQALADERINAICTVTRRPLDAEKFPANPKLENIIVDFSTLPNRPVWCSVNAVICTLGTTIKVAGSKAAFAAVDLELPVNIARLAKAAGATRFGLNSSLGANALSPNFYLRTKGDAEEQITALDYPSLTIVRPSLINAEREKTRTGEKLGLLAAHLFKPLIPQRYRPVTAAQIATALLEGVIVGKSGVKVIESDAL
ncbi:MAG: NAD(P)H-binding protein [Rhodocyclaceae bacterium]|nr:NAD(P)H-binding protein [Rhodocyclaceae bacterium]